MPPRKSKKPLARFSVNIPQELYDKVNQIVQEKTAEEKGAIEWSMAAIVRYALQEFIEKYEKEKQEKQG